MPKVGDVRELPARLVRAIQPAKLFARHTLTFGWPSLLAHERNERTETSARNCVSEAARQVSRRVVNNRACATPIHRFNIAPTLLSVGRVPILIFYCASPLVARFPGDAAFIGASAGSLHHHQGEYNAAPITWIIYRRRGKFHNGVSRQ